MSRVAYVLLVGAVACIVAEPFPCSEDAQCRLNGLEGTCEAEKYCSYPDEQCPSGSRYESEAPGELAGACVDFEASDDSGSGSGSGDESGDEPDCVAFDAIALGNLYTCARDVEGYLWCWGQNLFGQLGPPASDYRAEPQRVEGLGPIKDFDVAASHACAIDLEDRLWCWGYNEDRQVDYSSTEIRIDEPRLIDSQGKTVRSVAVGLGTTCVALEDETYCWGTILDNSVTEPLLIPSASEGFGFMDGGRLHACGLGAQGNVQCWGADEMGQLGDAGDAGGGDAVDVLFLDPGRVVQLSVGRDHSCVIFEPDEGSGQSVYCWGANDNGESGLLLPGPITNPHTPVGDFVGGQFAAISAGFSHSCVVTVEGALFCWGLNDFGQGNYMADVEWQQGPNAAPLPFAESPAVVALEGGQGHSCALREDGSLDCWGCNISGQLGTEPRDCPDRSMGATEAAPFHRVCAVNP